MPDSLGTIEELRKDVEFNPNFQKVKMSLRLAITMSPVQSPGPKSSGPGKGKDGGWRRGALGFPPPDPGATGKYAII